VVAILEKINMGRLGQITSSGTGRLIQLREEEEQDEISQPPVPKKPGLIKTVAQDVKGFAEGDISFADVASEVPETIAKGAGAFASTFVPAIKNFFLTTGSILGEGLAYAVDPEVRKQFKAGGLEILPTITSTTQVDVARATIAAGFETAVYRSFPQIIKIKFVKRGGAGALQGLGFAVADGLANDESAEEIIKKLPEYGLFGGALAIMSPYLLPILKAEMKRVPKEIKNMFKGMIKQKGKLPPGTRELSVKSTAPDGTPIVIKKPTPVDVAPTSAGPTPIPISTRNSRYEAYLKSQGYEPYIPNEQLPIVRITGGKPEGPRLPTIEAGAPTSIKLPVQARLNNLAPEQRAEVLSETRTLFGRGMEFQAAQETALLRFEGRQGISQKATEIIPDAPIKAPPTPIESPVTKIKQPEAPITPKVAPKEVPEPLVEKVGKFKTVDEFVDNQIDFIRTEGYYGLDGRRIKSSKLKRPDGREEVLGDVERGARQTLGGDNLQNTTLARIVRDSPDGFTINLNGKPLTRGYAFSPYKDREVILDVVDKEAIRKFLIKNEDLLLEDGHFLGGWKNTKDGKFYLDVTVVDNNKNRALERSLQSDQIAIFDLSTGKELNTLDTLKSELTNIFNKAKGGIDETRITPVPREQLPVGEGKARVSRLESRVKGVLDDVKPEKAQEAGITTFQQMNKADQIRKATEFVEKNPDDVIPILSGQKPAPSGLLHNSIMLAAEKNAELTKDVGLAIKLASLRSTRAGQEISILTESDPSNPISKIHEIIEARTGRAQRKLKAGDTVQKATTKIEQELTSEVTKQQLKIAEAEKLLNNLVC